MAAEQPRFKLGYWHIRGLAAPARMLLFFCGERDFEDKRYMQGDPPELSREAWRSEKESLGFDFPNLPYLEDRAKGIKITQSMAILRYIAAEGGLPAVAPAMEPYLAMLEGLAMDIRNGLTRMCYGSKTQEDVAKFFALLKTGFHFVQLDEWLGGKERGGPFACGALSFVDFFLVEHLEQIQLLGPGALDGFAHIRSYMQAFASMPEIAAFAKSDYFIELPVNNKSAFLGGKTSL